MLEKNLLAKVERLLSQTWGGEVQLAFQSSFEDHPHVARLSVIRAPGGAPATIYLKRWRSEGEDRYDPGESSQHLFNDWASLEFLQNLTGCDAISPQLYGGSLEDGFLVMEDLADDWPLTNLLQPGNPAEAAQTLAAYGRLLGKLHGQTAGLQDRFIAVRQSLSREFSVEPENYNDEFNYTVMDLNRLGYSLPPQALLDLQQAAAILTHPGEFSALTQGDAVFTNIIAGQGRWRLVDFEAARYRHALYEGAFLRMLFPTSGLLFVRRIPEPAWRQAEAAYRDMLSTYLPAAREDAQYGLALTAACAFWILSFYGGWLERALGDAISSDRLTHLRRCIITRGEIFANTTREFQALPHLGEFIGGLVDQFRSEWPLDDLELPFYPAFSA